MAVESINPVSEAYSLGGLKRVDRLRVESHGRNEGIVDDPGKEWARDDGVVNAPIHEGRRSQRSVRAEERQ